VVRQEREGLTDMIQSSVEPRMAELKIDLLARRKNIWHITDILCGFDVVDGYATIPLDEFHIPGSAVFGGQDPDVGGLASTFRE
jgi:hypothetical protein